MLLTFKTQDASHNVSWTWYKNGDGWIKYNNSELTLSSLPAAFDDIYATIVLVSSNTYSTFYVYNDPTAIPTPGSHSNYSYGTQSSVLKIYGRMDYQGTSYFYDG